MGEPTKRKKREDKRGSQVFFREYIESGTDVRLACLQDTNPKLSSSNSIWQPFEVANRAVGLHAAYDRRSGDLEALAITLDLFCVQIRFSNNQPDLSKLEGFLTRPNGLFVAFNASELAYALYHRSGIRVTNLVDIHTVFPTAESPHALSLVKVAVDGAYKIYETNISDAFETDYYTDDKDVVQDVVLMRKAWLAQFLPTLEGKYTLFEEAAKIDTKKLPESLLHLVSAKRHSIRRSGDMRALRQEHDVTAVQGDTGAVLQSNRYQNRLRRPAEHQSIQVEIQTPRGTYVQSGAQVAHLQGAKASIVIPDHDSKSHAPIITSAVTLGRDRLTLAEINLNNFLAKVLHDHSVFTENPWIKNIEIIESHSDMSWPEAWKKDKAPKKLLPSDIHSHDILNPSQLTAIQRMISPSTNDHISLIHGPPGTGKTTVIARYVQTVSALAASPKDVGVWLVAQSNVAVKNIAEKLFAVGFLDWKLLVSKEFQEGWHDHLYEGINSHVIRSNNFKEGVKKLGDCKVILCTLSTLSNQHIPAFTTCVPFRNLIIDEASQVKIFDYYHVFDMFKPTLRKVVFIGDPKQLPPHGQEEIKDLSSIFEKPHLTETSHLLDIQCKYRMPPQIGQFISTNVYDDKLFSNPKHSIPDTTLACQFIDTKGGESKDGFSFKNQAEINAAILLATHLEAQKLSYRIITPYDAQRSALEAAMKENPNINWKDKCFNVDSFQGNEDDYIILSLVRTWKLGFLENLRRTNVMLSRCKKGMFILGNRVFLEGKGKDCLVGNLAGYMVDRVGPEMVWMDVKELEKDTFDVQRKVEVLTGTVKDTA